MFTERLKSLKTIRTAINITSETTNNQYKKYNSVKHIQRQQFSLRKTSIKVSLKILSLQASSLSLKTHDFKHALILVFVNENCCLCKCFTELYFFYWLLVVSCNFNRFAVCFQSFINIACRSTKNAAPIKRFLDYTSL